MLVCVLLGVLAGPAAARADTGPAWARQALDLQHGIADDVPLANAPWVGTHNSFNSVAEMGLLLSPLDSNQQITIDDQLDAGMRSLELDLHNFPTVRNEVAIEPVVCHATEAVGCTLEKPFRQVLAEIDGWLDRHPAAILLLYLEDDLRTADAHALGAGALGQVLGEKLYKPGYGGCKKLPVGSLTRDKVRAAGAQVVAVAGGCGQGPGWPALVFNWDSHEEERPQGFRDYPDCGPDFRRAEYQRDIIRYYEDSTILTRLVSLLGASSVDDGIDVRTTAAFARCGVDLIGFDQVSRDDPRVAGAIWSWAPGQPSGPWHCATLRVERATPYGRWYSRRCAGRRRPLCRRGEKWVIPGGRVSAARAAKACRRHKARNAAPRTGYEAQLAREHMARRGAGEVWLGVRPRGNAWRGLDRR